MLESVEHGQECGVITTISLNEVSSCATTLLCVRVCAPVEYQVFLSNSASPPPPLHTQIWIACLPDHSKLRVNLSHLKTGKYILKRRSA